MIFNSTAAYAIASTTYDNDNVLGPIKGKGWWRSDYLSKQSYSVIFKRKIYITHYSMQTVNWDIDKEHPKQWDLFGIDSNNSTLISRITNSGLNGPLLSKTYETTSKGPFHALQFMSTGETYGIQFPNRFVIEKLEFFGKFVGGSSLCTKAKTLISYLNVFVFVFV